MGPNDTECLVAAFIEGSSTIRYVNARARTISIVFCGEVFWLLLIGIVHIHGGASKGLLAVMASLVLTTAIRSGISFVLMLEPDRLTTRTLIRTRSWAYCELQSAEGFVSSEEMGSRSIIVLRPKMGKPYAFKTFGEASDAALLTHPAVQQINARIFYSALIHPVRRARA